MRILYLGIGECETSEHLPQSWPDRLFAEAGRWWRAGKHELVTFGYARGLDIQIDFGDPFSEVVERLPAGWVPDVCVCVHPDFLMIPPGIEDAPFPTVAVTADWDYRIGVARTMADAFDLVVALGDASCRAMASLGAKRTLPFAYFGFPEQSIPAELTPIDRHRPIDVLFTGVIADNTSPERSRWLQRLARLADRHRIHIDSARMPQTTYRHLLREAKLVFTFHRRGELQLRFTDAAIEGACVLDNGVETARYFDPRTEYAAYDETDFEAQIEQHLQDEGLRRRKVEAARQRVTGGFGSVQRMVALFDAIEGELPYLDPEGRAARKLSSGERCRRAAEQLYANQFVCSLGPNEDYLSAAFDFARRATPGPRAMNDLAVLSTSHALRQIEPSMDCPSGRRALSLFEQLTRDHPRYAMGWFNRAFALRAKGEHATATVSFVRAYELLLDPQSEFDAWALYCRDQDRQPHSFEKPLLEAQLELVAGGSDDAARRVLAGNCAYFMARHERAEGRWHEAFELMGIATRLDPVNAVFAREAGRLADLLGADSDADLHFQQALGLRPLDVPLRFDVLRRHARTDRPRQALELLRETLALVRGVRGNAVHFDEVQALARSLLMGRKGIPALADLPRDRFATDAITELGSSLGEHPDIRIVVRIHELLRLQGKHSAADEWAAHFGVVPDGPDMAPSRGARVTGDVDARSANVVPERSAETIPSSATR